VLGDLTVDDFAGRMGETFTLRASDGGALEITLAQVDPSPESQRPDRRVPFSLIFHGPETPLAPQAIWRVEHDDLGELDIFLVPLGPEGEVPMRYEAVFT
jgi:uncharacterized protein DUF6916